MTIVQVLLLPVRIVFGAIFAASLVALLISGFILVSLEPE